MGDLSKRLTNLHFKKTSFWRTTDEIQQKENYILTLKQLGKKSCIGKWWLYIHCEGQCLYVCVCMQTCYKMIKIKSSYLSPLIIIFLWHEYLKSTFLAISKAMLHHSGYGHHVMKKVSEPPIFQLMETLYPYPNPPFSYSPACPCLSLIGILLSIYVRSQSIYFSVSGLFHLA